MSARSITSIARELRARLVSKNGGEGDERTRDLVSELAAALDLPEASESAAPLAVRVSKTEAVAIEPIGDRYRARLIHMLDSGGDTLVVETREGRLILKPGDPLGGLYRSIAEFAEL